MKRLLLLFAVIVCFSGCAATKAIPSFQGPASTSSVTVQQSGPTNGHPLVPMPDGASISYIVRAITGTWHANSGYLDINTRVLIETQKIEYSQVVTKYGVFTASHRTTPSNPSYPGITLLDGMHTLPSSARYYGEWGNTTGWFHYPPLPKLTLFPVAGERIDLVSSVYQDDSSTVPLSTFATVYRTLEHLDTYGVLGAGDYWRTSLWEVGGNHVYNYVYGYSSVTGTTGLLAFWHGELSVDGTSIVGLEKRQVVP